VVSLDVHSIADLCSILPATRDDVISRLSDRTSATASRRESCQWPLARHAASVAPDKIIKTSTKLPFGTVKQNFSSIYYTHIEILNRCSLMLNHPKNVTHSLEAVGVRTVFIVQSFSIEIELKIVVLHTKSRSCVLSLLCACLIF
jgi:hypothetical protein